jgi:hypothetical protein
MSIDFAAPTAGTYHVTLDFGTSIQCEPALPADVNVRQPGANEADFRVRVIPPATASVPAQDIPIHVYGGADFGLGAKPLDEGALRQDVLSPQVPAYIRFSATGTTSALTEAFTDMFGNYDVRLLGTAYDVVVIPTGGNAPQRIRSWLPGQGLSLQPGHAVTGKVKDAGGAGIANAKVSLQLDGVPTTIGTTQSDGSFSVLGDPNATATSNVDIEVTPPASSGLPRLVASGKFNPTAMITISYTAAVSVVSVAGVHARRGGANQPNARVTVFGTLAGAGLVNASASATGEVRLSATANASGDLPAGTLVARGVLSGVVDAGGALGVGAFDTTGTIPAAIDTNGPVAGATTIRDVTNATLDGVAVDAVPAGALAAAGGAVVHGTTGVSGSVTLTLASGGHYTLRVFDPKGRGAQGTPPDVVAGSLPTVALGKAIHITGYVLDGTSPIAGASIQILCYACTGIDASRPIAEIATSVSGGFSLAVPDPGTM